MVYCLNGSYSLQKLSQSKTDFRNSVEAEQSKMDQMERIDLTPVHASAIQCGRMGGGGGGGAWAYVIVYGKLPPT